jgi:septal ring factor EnvC (AmiA/AmiB activator)
MDNISIEAHQVLQVIANAMSRTPDVSPRIIEVLKLILNPEGYLPSDVEAALQPLIVRLDQSLANQQTQNQRIGEIMATLADFQGALTAVEQATTKSAAAVTAIADRIAALETQIANMGLTEEQEDALLSQVRGISANAATLATSLEGMGKTPETPVPTPTPEPLPPVEPTPTPGEPV